MWYFSVDAVLNLFNVSIIDFSAQLIHNTFLSNVIIEHILIWNTLLDHHVMFGMTA